MASDREEWRNMPWYLVSWFNSAGDPIQRELLERWDNEKVWAYIDGKIRHRSLPRYAQMVSFDAAPESLIYDWDSDKPAKPSPFPIEIPELLLREHKFPSTS
jgi:hypothetical protein